MNNGLSTPVDQTLSEFFVGTTPSKPHTNTFRQSLLTDGKTEAERFNNLPSITQLSQGQGWRSSPSRTLLAPLPELNHP